MKFASLFTGFGGADIGALQAGLEPIWGIEIDPKIMLIAQDNIHETSVLCGDVRQINFNNFIKHRPDWLHASPPCINASRAKNGKETQEDIDLADAICRAIAALRPDYFSVENVAGYHKYISFAKILNYLEKNDYCWDAETLDCSDYGVPQTRKRLFLVATKKDSLGMMLCDIPKVEKKVSWKETIADLIPSLKPTTLTEWQKQAIINKAEYQTSFNTLKPFVIQRSGARKKDGIPNNMIRLAHQPMFTIKAMSGNVRLNVNQVTLVIDGVPYEADLKCLSRWQTFPDWYQLPADKKLAVKGIGNAVPPLMMQKIIEAVLK
jgi:DNA (cytosine-5)-methyltransferase 1